MKKMILGLALCLGLSQVVVAQKEEVAGLNNEDAKGALAWIKNNPKKATAIGAAIVATLTYGTFAAVEIYKSDVSDGKIARVKAGAKQAANDMSVPAVWAWEKAVAGKDVAFANVKEHPRMWVGVPAAVVAVIMAAVIAHYSELDKTAQDKITNLWNKLFKKADKEEVVSDFDDVVDAAEVAPIE